MDKTLTLLAKLSDEDLLARVADLATNERDVTVLLIAHLAELDARRLYLAEGHSSLFTYCTQVLCLSEHAAYGRIEAARAGRKFPVLLEMLAEGSLTLTTVALLAPHLTAENHQALLEKARHQSKRAVEQLVAGVFPQPPVPTLVRRLPVAGSNLASTSLLEATPTGPSASSPAPAKRSPTVAPLAPERYRVQFTASEKTCEKLRQVQALLRHQIPDGDLDQILDRALTVLLEKLAREKLAATERPRKGRPTSVGSRHIPAEVKRAVWLRDGGRCAFVGTKGRRCDEVAFLEFHHVTPFAVGGASTIANIQLRCRNHNGYEADLYFDLTRIRESGASYSVRTELCATSKQGPLRVQQTRRLRKFVPEFKEDNLRAPPRGVGRR